MKSKATLKRSLFAARDGNTIVFPAASPNRTTLSRNRQIVARLQC